MRMGVRSLGREDPLEEGMATPSSILVWRILWTGAWGGAAHNVAKRQTRLKQVGTRTRVMDLQSFQHILLYNHKVTVSKISSLVFFTIFVVIIKCHSSYFSTIIQSQYSILVIISSEYDSEHSLRSYKSEVVVLFSQSVSADLSVSRKCRNTHVSHMP